MEEVSGTPITARAERDRYVAFAFAAADLLLEVDPAGLIAFATGAAKSIADRDVDALIGANFLDIIQDADRGLAKLMLTTLNQRGRLSPVPVRLSDANQSMALLGGCRLPTDVTRHHLTFTILPGIGQAPAIGKRSEQTGLLSKDDFARIAEQWLNRTDGDYRISLLGVGGLDKVREAAGELAAGRFGLIHRGELDERLLQQKISDLAATIDLQDRIVVAKHTLELSAPDLTAADAARTRLPTS